MNDTSAQYGNFVCAVNPDCVDNAAKVLCYLPLKGLYYLREEFSDGKSYVEFDRSILWFPDSLEVGHNSTSQQVSRGTSHS